MKLKRLLGYILGLFIMYGAIDGVYYLITDHPVKSTTSFLITLCVGLVIDFSIKAYTKQIFWTPVDIYKQLKNN